jgi:tetratricopeptide (TPR) repeat protein
LYYNFVMECEDIKDLAKNFVNPNVNEDMLNAINFGIAEGFCRNGDIEDGMALYKEIRNVSTQNLITPDFVEKIRNLAEQLFLNKKYTNALIQYKRILGLSELSAEEYLNTAICLIELDQTKAAIEFLRKYELAETDKEDALANLAEIFGLKLKMYPEAISCLEKYIKLNQKNALAYNTLGHFYSLYCVDENLDKQLKCFLNAYKLQPNNPMYVRNVIYIYDRLEDTENTEKYYKKLFKLNPSHYDYYNYGCFLIQQGDFTEGYKYYEHRFFVTERPLKYPDWLDENIRLKSCENISDKTLLVFHDSGYGDTITYIRYMEQFKKLAKKVILFLPEKLIGLFKASGVDVEMHHMTDDLSEIDYDYNVPMLDLPRYVGATVETIPNADGYLKVSQEKIEAYQKKYLKDSGKIKIGISYCANPEYNNITNRDIPFTVFYPLTKLENVEVYSFQVADAANQINNLPKGIKITDLAPTFKDFEDTAAAMMNMDLIISTDNVILNLAGALGVKTFGLFNRFPETRWFKTTGEDVGWYKSVKPYRAKKFDGWHELINNVIKEISHSLK